MRADDHSVRGYNRLAPIYESLEFALFGRSLQRARVALVDRVPSIRTGLVLGDGNGRLLEQLCHVQPECSFTSVDQSSEMIELQRKRMARVGVPHQVEFVCEDARDFDPSGREYDLLVAAFFLDCFSELQLARLIPRWLAGLRAGGIFYFVDFVQPRSGWRQCQAAVYQALMHGFFRWQTGLPNRRLVDLDPILNQQDLLMIESASEIHPMIACRLYQFGG